MQDPSKYLFQCSSSTLRYFQSFPGPLKRGLCTLYTAIQASPAQPAAYTLFSQLLRMGAIFMPIVALESHRQTSFWARRGIDFFLLLAQGLSGAVSIPLYFAAITSGNELAAELPKRLRPEQPWTIFVSTVIGYLLPMLYGVQTGWSNAATTNFLLFPIYYIALNRILPPILARLNFLRSLDPKLLIRLTAIVAGLLSVNGHALLLLSGISPKRIFWPFVSEPSTTRDLHILLAHDYVFCLVALASFVILYCHGSKTRQEKWRLLRGLLIQSLLFGPTAAIANVWSDSFGEAELDSDGHSRVSEGERQHLLASGREQ